MINFKVSFLLLKSRKKWTAVNIPWHSTLKSQNPRHLNSDISAVYAPILLQKTSFQGSICFSRFTLMQYLRSVVSPLKKTLRCVCFTFSPHQRYMSLYSSVLSIGYQHYCGTFDICEGIFFLLFEYFHAGNFYVTRTVTNEFSTKHFGKKTSSLRMHDRDFVFTKQPLIILRAQMPRISSDDENNSLGTIIMLTRWRKVTFFLQKSESKKEQWLTRINDRKGRIYNYYRRWWWFQRMGIVNKWEFKVAHPQSS